MVTQSRLEVVGAAVVLAVILAALWVSGSIDVAQFGIKEHLSGPRGYPRALLLVGLTLSVAQIAVALRELRRDAKGDGKPADLSIAKLGRPFVLLVGLVVFALLLETAGYMIAMTMLLVFGARIYGAGRWWHAIAIAIGFTLGSIVLFRFGLDTVLPEGWLGIDALLGN